MNILRNKKFIISLVLVILLVGLTAVVQVKSSASERLEEYNKYCNENCVLTRVSKQELSDTIEVRESSAVSSIEEDTITISETKSYLDSKDLSDSEAETYESIAISSEYDSDVNYTTDELISLEKDYNVVTTQLQDLKRSYQVRINKKSIKSYKTSISKSKEYLDSVTLSDSEKKKYDSYNDDYKTIGYDETKKDYTVKELGAFKQSYKDLDTKYSKLVKSVKARIKEEKEQAEAEAQAQLGAQTQVEASTQSTWSNDTSYSSGTTSNNSGGSSSSNSGGSSSGNSGSASSGNGGSASSGNGGSASNENSGDSSSNSGGGTTAEVMPDYCYSSESSAYAVAEKEVDTNDYVGFGVYPGCGGNMDWWEIYWK